MIPEPWIYKIDGKPPYDANYTAEISDETQPIEEDSNRVKFMTMLIRKAAWTKERGMVTSTVAK